MKTNAMTYSISSHHSARIVLPCRLTIHSRNETLIHQASGEPISVSP